MYVYVHVHWIWINLFEGLIHDFFIEYGQKIIVWYIGEYKTKRWVWALKYFFYMQQFLPSNYIISNAYLY